MLYLAHTMTQDDLTPEQQEERAKAIAHEVMRKNDTVNAHKVVKRAQITLIVLAAFTVILGTLLGSGILGESDWWTGGTYLFLAVFYGGMAWWSRVNPAAALLTALLVYLGLLTLDGIFEPASALQGLLWKFIIIILLGKGWIDARKLPKPKPAQTSDVLDSDEIMNG